VREIVFVLVWHGSYTCLRSVTHRLHIVTEHHVDAGYMVVRERTRERERERVRVRVRVRVREKERERERGRGKRECVCVREQLQVHIVMELP